MTKINSYTIRLPYATCEKMMNNETANEAIASRRDMKRTIKSRSVDNKCLAPNVPVEPLAPGQVFKERVNIISTKAGRMQRAYGFDKWQQDYKIEKTGPDTAKCTDCLRWDQTGTTAHRSYTLRGSGDNAVLMCLNPWIINLKGISIILEPTIRGRMEVEMAAADKEFPEIIESAARALVKKRRAA